MQALVKLKSGKGNIELLNVDIPNPSENEVLVKVHAVGICGTDLKIQRGEAWCNPPVILGHEVSGTIYSVGDNVIGLKAGDRVVTETAQIICGHCYYCRTGTYLMCPDRLSIGYGTNGGMAEFIRIRSDIIHKIPDSVSLDCAALCEPTAVAIHAVFDSTRVTSTDIAVIFGCGAIGNLVAQTAKSLGATVVICGIGSDERRLAIAAETGADYTINLEKENLKEVIDSLTGGMGADLIYECSGSKDAIHTGMNLLKRKGSFIQVGLTEATLEIDYGLFTAHEIRIIGSFGHNWGSWETAIKLINNGKIKTKPLITNRYSIKNWEDGFTSASNGNEMKILIYPNELVK